MIIERFLARGELQKRAETTDERDRLRHEARVLEVARHPGVVELLAVEGDALRLRLVDGRPFTDLVDPSDDELTRIALAAATTLADLHDLGVAHRGLSAEHLLIDRGGQPVLCSFGRAQVGEVERDAAMADVRGLAGVVAADRVMAAAAQAGRWPSPARGFAIRLAATRAQPQRRWGFQPAARGAALASASVAVIAGAVVVGGGYPRPAPPPAAAHATPVGQAGPPRSAGQPPQRGGSADRERRGVVPYRRPGLPPPAATGRRHRRALRALPDR